MQVRGKCPFQSSADPHEPVGEDVLFASATGNDMISIELTSFTFHRIWMHCLWFLIYCSVFLFAFDSSASTNAATIIELSAPELPAPPEKNISYICDSNKEPDYQGVPISQWLRDHTGVNPEKLSLSNLLRLKQVSPPDDNLEMVTVEIPVNYDALTNGLGGSVRLGWFNKGGDFVEGCFTGSERALNGHCSVWWTIDYDRPGKHDIRARLSYSSGLDTINIIGPALAYYSSNVCQFFEGYSLFNSSGALLQARLRERTAKYRIELTTLKGKHLKSITGVSTNGTINLEWDLKDDRGKKFKGDSFRGSFYVMYPDDTRTNPPARDIFNRVGHPTN